MNVKDRQIILKAAKAGGKIVKSYFGKVLTVSEKSMASDFRTEADTESEAAIISILKKAFPAYNIFSEECGMIAKNSEYTFYIDPLDGTNNFVIGIPNFSVSIALVRGREIVFGAVYLPMLNLMYTAAKGDGAFCNSVKIKPSTETFLSRSTGACSYGYRFSQTSLLRVVGNFSRKTKRILINWSGAADFCLLASGKIETVVNRKTELHDFLAGKLIAKEAGCVVTDFAGKPERDDLNHTFLASNNLKIHRQVLSLL